MVSVLFFPSVEHKNPWTTSYWSCNSERNHVEELPTIFKKNLDWAIQQSNNKLKGRANDNNSNDEDNNYKNKESKQLKATTSKVKTRQQQPQTSCNDDDNRDMLELEVYI